MNRGLHPDASMIVIDVIPVTNVCLMVIAAFYGGRAATEDEDASWRVRLGLAAVCFGLCSQVFFLMLAALSHGWVPSYSGNSFNHFEGTLANIGASLCTATFFSALLARGLRRYSGLWVAITSGCIWSLWGLSVGLRSLFR